MSTPIPSSSNFTDELSELILGPGQDLVLRDEAGNERLRLDASRGLVIIRDADGRRLLFHEGDQANLRLGGAGRDGDLLLVPRTGDDATSPPSIHLNADGAEAIVGTEARPGRVVVVGRGHATENDGERGRIIATDRIEIRTFEGSLRIRFDADGSASLGGGGTEGRLELDNGSGQTRIALDAATAHGRLGGDGRAGRLSLHDGSGTRTVDIDGSASLMLGAGGHAGTLIVRGEQGEDSIVLNGLTANVGVGRQGEAGGVFVKDATGQDSIVLNGATANIGVGRNGEAGAIFVKDGGGNDSIVLDGANGDVRVGRAGHAGDLTVANGDGVVTIHLDGQRGDILLSNADCAEDFDVAVTDVGPEPGTVLVIEEGERLRESTRAYDHRVAGVVSGAGAYRPGIVLDRRTSDSPRASVALMGKVMCKADAAYGPIACGDLLTTSDTPGHAMKATDSSRYAGAVLGKALGALDEGCGFVPVLVALQ